MTYRELKFMLEEFTDAELDCTVTGLLLDAGEFVQIDELAFAHESDTLDPGHPFFMV